MLVRFTVENFMSFKERTEFNMLSGDYRRHKHHVTDAGGVPLVRAAAIYGANGSGKSNLVKAMEIYFQLLQKGKALRNTKTPAIFQYKLDANTLERNTLFEGEFYVEGSFIEFGIETKGGVIKKEWLGTKGSDTTKPHERVYTRIVDSSGKTTLSFGSAYTSATLQTLGSILEEKFSIPDMLILHMLSKNGIEIVDKFCSNSVFNVGATEPIQNLMNDGAVLAFIHDVPIAFDYINALISVADFGIKKIEMLTWNAIEFLGKNESSQVSKLRIELQEGKNYVDVSNNFTRAIAVIENDDVVVKELVFIHGNKSNEGCYFRFSEESDGTQTSLGLLFLLTFLKRVKSIFVIDELERSLHPLLATAFIKKFMADPDVQGQLVFTTHESRLLDLDIFRQDEIWFAQKNQEGVSSIYPLSDYEVRHDLDLENGYLNGRFGGVPFLGELEQLKTNPKQEEV